MCSVCHLYIESNKMLIEVLFLVSCSRNRTVVSIMEQESQSTPSISRADAIYQVKQIKKRNSNISKENQIFSNYLKRVEPAESVANRSTAVHKQSGGDSVKLGRKKSKSTRVSVEVLQLSTEQKCDIASNELEEIFTQIELMKEDSEKKLDGQHAAIEETEITLGELKKSRHEYERLITQGAVSKHTGMWRSHSTIVVCVFHAFVYPR